MVKKEQHAISLHGLFELCTSLNNTDLPVGFQESIEAAVYLNLLENILLSCNLGKSQPNQQNCFETRFEVFCEI